MSAKDWLLYITTVTIVVVVVQAIWEGFSCG